MIAVFAATSIHSPWPKSTPPTLYSTVARVVSVPSGDALVVDNIGFKRNVRLHLWGIAAPEEGQSGFEEARRFLCGEGKSSYIGKTVRFNILDCGRDGTLEATLEFVFIEGNEAYLDTRISLLINSGLVWWYRQQATDWPEMERAMKMAPKLKVGIWKDNPNPVPPWIFRLRHVLDNRETGNVPPKKNCED